ncbi:ABC transporter permease [Flavitalea sp. BT771]|uniref:ABC transporter permease n=1 Tax=Flavitalea sp. BT771 TaxID=3063329 RepID=UPI0026E3ADA4|nr:ABC transporter permease [Flavitalea sp. BT771]MDO6432908.1 ABC transporter permease [Flavitalea sp. BT771]MDV6221816.1 ABC transporter permease [Flavitalea sp. BT771]
MFKNYFLIAWRNLKNNKAFSFINISGLAIGLATCLLILLYVTDELSYDRWNKEADRIYRIDGDLHFGGNYFNLATVPEPMGAAMKRDYPEVQQFVRFRGYGGMLVKKGQQNIQENRVTYTDSTLFSVFTLPMIQGDPGRALAEPRSVVITEKMALKYFNSTDVVGKYLTVNDTGNLKVTGVIRNIPEQSHFQFDFFISSRNSIQRWELDDWLSNNFNTYVLLKPGADARRLEARLPQIVDRYIGPRAQAVMNVNLDQFQKSGNYLRYSLMPLTAIHLYSNKTAELAGNGSIQYVYIFSTIAVFILLIACINFMNLSTARSAGRAKEVGVRKVLGSTRQSLIRQFLMESMLVCFIALALAVIIAISLLPLFNQLASKSLTPDLFGKPWLLASLLLLTVVVGLLAGSYPALFLSAFRPAQVLKGKLAAGFRSGWLRSSLVVFQFAISVVLMVGTIVIYRQLNYIRNKNIGYNRDQVLVLQNTNALGSQTAAFKEEILKMNGAERATMTGYLPTSTWRNDYPLFPDPGMDASKAASMQIWNVDENYIPTLGMQMVQGRNFSRDFLTDSTGIILNESAARLLGFRDAVNKDLYSLDNFPARDLTHLHVVGVVKDFNFNSLREQVTPLAMRWRKENGSIAVRTTTKNIPGLINQIEAKWRTMAPGQPFNYSFMDDDFNNKYRTEQRTGGLFIAFASLAIFIACLGLLGLAMFTAEQRTREIGIRKVLGASVGSVITLLTRDFLRLVLLAIVVASPLAWWAMHHWLQDFAYRTSINWTVFAMATGAALLTALGTISVQALKSAMANPVKSLRTE